MTHPVRPSDIRHLIRETQTLEQQDQADDWRNKIESHAAVYRDTSTASVDSRGFQRTPPSFHPSPEQLPIGPEPELSRPHPSPGQLPTGPQPGMPRSLNGTPMPPEMGPALAQWLVSNDLNRSGSITSDELATFFQSRGIPGGEARETAQALFSVVGKQELTANDMGAVQDAVTRAWIAANPQAAEQTLNHATQRWGRIEGDDIASEMRERGWPTEVAESFARVTTGGQGGSISRFRTDNIVEDISHSQAAQTLAREIHSATLLGAAYQGTVAFSQAPAHIGGVGVTAAAFVSRGLPQPGAPTSLHGAPTPPEMDTGIARWLANGDYDRSGDVTATELSAFFTARGVAPNAAHSTASALFSSVGKDRVDAGDMSDVQDAVTRAWIAANPDTAREFLEDVDRGWGGVDANDIASQMQDRGWPANLAESFARVTTQSQSASNSTPFGFHHFWGFDASDAIQDISRDQSAQTLAHEIHVASVSAAAAPQVAATPVGYVGFSIMPAQQAAMAVAAQNAAISQFVHSADVNGDMALSPDELSAALTARGVPEQQATDTTQALFSLAAHHRGATSMPATLTVHDLARLT